MTLEEWLAKPHKYNEIKISPLALRGAPVKPKLIPREATIGQRLAQLTCFNMGRFDPVMIPGRVRESGEGNGPWGRVGFKTADEAMEFIVLKSMAQGFCQALDHEDTYLAKLLQVEIDAKIAENDASNGDKRDEPPTP